MIVAQTNGWTGPKVEHIAKSTIGRKAKLQRAAKAALPLTLILPLTGCMGSAFDLMDSPQVDRSISTSTIARGKPADPRSDEATVQNAVTSADLGKLGKGPLPWANATTGSAGVVTAIREEKADGLTCRQFETTRHSYEGIAYFEGKACILNSGSWQLLGFAKR